MKKLENSLFKKFENEKLEKSYMTRVEGGETGDIDCTGDAMSPDCGDNQGGTNIILDSTPTELSDDSCNVNASDNGKLNSQHRYFNGQLIDKKI